MRALLALTALLVLSSPARASVPSPSDEDPGTRVATLARSLMSPFCPGRTLQSCPSPQATAWLADVRAWIVDGRSDGEIVRLLQARAPDFDLEGPPASAGWLLGLAPIGAATSVLVAAWLVLRRRRFAEGPAEQPEKGDEAFEDILDEELTEVD